MRDARNVRRASLTPALPLHSLANVILGGYGTPAPSAAAAGVVEKLEPIETDVDSVAAMLLDAKKVIIAPGYGLAVARAQYPVAEMVSRLRARGVDVCFAIHPVGFCPLHRRGVVALC